MYFAVKKFLISPAKLYIFTIFRVPLPRNFGDFGNFGTEIMKSPRPSSGFPTQCGIEERQAPRYSK